MYVWQVPEKNATQGQLLVSIPLESTAVSFALLKEISGQVLAALSASGKISVFDTSDKSISPPSTGQKVTTLKSRSQISTPSKTGEPATKIVSISPVVGRAGCIGIARLVNGVRPIFDVTVSRIYSQHEFSPHTPSVILTKLETLFEMWSW